MQKCNYHSFEKANFSTSLVLSPFYILILHKILLYKLLSETKRCLNLTQINKFLLKYQKYILLNIVKHGLRKKLIFIGILLKKIKKSLKLKKKIKNKKFLIKWQNPFNHDLLTNVVAITKKF